MQALLTATSDGFDRSSEEERTERLRGRQLTESATLQLRSAFASDLRVWQVWHQIDEASPLYRIRDSLKSDLKWVDVSLTAFDQVYMQEVRMHANYTSSDLVEGARFDEMASLDFDGRRHTVDLSKIDAHHYIDARGRRQRTFKRLNVGAMLAKVQWGGVEGAHHRGSVSGASQPHHLNPDGTARRSFEMTSMFRRASRSVRPAPPKLAEALRDAERNREVLVHYEGVGDYAAAVGVVAAAALAPLSDGELRDGAAVRAVRALNKLGEYKWRYRVVDEGGSPRDEAIAVLEEARGLIAAAIERTPLARQAVARRSWAPELSEALHGLAVARLIFNGDDAEDHTISALLDEALSLRQATPALAAEAAETFNSMGMLRLKRRHLSDAEGHFERSLALRWQLDEGTPEARRDKAKALAQSLTSLGNLVRRARRRRRDRRAPRPLPPRPRPAHAREGGVRQGLRPRGPREGGVGAAGDRARAPEARRGGGEPGGVGAGALDPQGDAAEERGEGPLRRGDGRRREARQQRLRHQTAERHQRGRS